MAEPYLNDMGMSPLEGAERPYVAAVPFVEPEPEIGPAKRRLLSIGFDEVEARRPMDRWQPKLNIAENLPEDQLQRIGRRVVENFGIDEGSRKDWLDRNKEAIRLANQIRKQKDWPWENAANVMLPLIADASIKFAARAYSEIIRDDQVVKGKVVGKDPDGSKDQRAQRVGRYMSWQLTEKMEEWEEDTDKLLHMVSVVGHVFRKKYYSPTLKRCVSELCLPEKVCVNNSAANLKSARRVTHILDATHKNKVVEKQRAGIWRKVELDADPAEGEPNEEAYYNLLEQHCWLDLDDDGYEEPYIVTVHKDTEKVLGLVVGYEPEDVRESDAGEILQIDRCLYFSDYKFIPPFDGGFYYIGFGALLAPGNEAANTIVNQLLDAGTAATVGGGFLSKEIKVKGGVYRFRPREFKRTEATAEQLAKGIFPMPVNEPSPTLFNLLGLILELTQDLASVKDVLAGDTPGANVPATTVLALIEQGMKTFNAIYKRIYRSLSREFKLLYRLNHKYLDEEEYFTVLDEPETVYRDDFEPETLDIVPVADPFLSTDVQRLARVESMVQDIPLGANPIPILRYKYETMRIDEGLIEEILKAPEQGPNPELLKLEERAQEAAANAQLREREIDIKEQEFDLKATRQEAELVEILSKAIKNFADAEAAEAGIQMQEYQTQMQGMLEGIRTRHQERQKRLAERKQAMDEQRAQQQPEPPIQS